MINLDPILKLISLKKYQQGKSSLSALLNSSHKMANHPVLYRLRATCSFALKEYHHAIVDLQQTERLGMKDGELYLNIAKCYLHLAELPQASVNLTNALACKDRFYSQAITFLHKKLLSRLNESELSVFTGYLHSELVDDDTARNGLANVYLVLGKIEEAMKVLERVELKSTPDIEITQAVAVRLNGESRKALATLISIEKKCGGHFAIYHQIANCYSDTGDLANACHFYSKSIQLNDQYRYSHLNFAELMFQRGLSKKMLSSYEQLAEKQRFNHFTFRDYLNFLLRLNDYHRVLSALEQHSQQFRSSTLLYFKAEAERLSGNRRAAVDVIKTVDPKQLTSDEMCQLAQHLISEEEYQLAVDFVEQVLSKDKQNQWALALYFLLSKNDIVTNERGIQFEDYIVEYQITAPDDFDSIEDYLNALKGMLNELHAVSESSPLNLTIHGGTQSQANLFSSNNPLIKHLYSEFKQGVVKALNKFEEKYTLHKGFNKKGNVDSSGSWSINMKENGYHSNHIHPMGLVSSVCYIALPDCISKENGGLQFGVPPFPTSFTPRKTVFQPECGVLYVFPSCWWHGTVPLKSGSERLTVAADFIIK